MAAFQQACVRVFDNVQGSSSNAIGPTEKSWLSNSKRVIDWDDNQSDAVIRSCACLVLCSKMMMFQGRWQVLVRHGQALIYKYNKSDRAVGINNDGRETKRNWERGSDSYASHVRLQRRALDINAPWDDERKRAGW